MWDQSRTAENVATGKESENHLELAFKSQVWRELDQRGRELDQLAEVIEELLHLKAKVAWVKSMVAEVMVELRKAKMREVEALRPGGA